MRECVNTLDRMSDDSKAQNIPQHKAKPIVKFIVPSPRTALNYLTLPVVPPARRQVLHANRHISGAISHSRAGFAEEPRQERTCVRDWSGDDRKARSGKARSLREHKKKDSNQCE